MPTSIRLDEETELRLTALAKETGRSKAFYLREIIRQGLEDVEDYYRAEQVMQRVRRGEEPIYSLEQVRTELGLDN
jgi:RHH-type transcriptional regulator, rel operon repressor / antitoxin RelB